MIGETLKKATIVKTIEIISINIQIFLFRRIILIPSSGPIGSKLKTARNAFIRHIKPTI